jgi:hypothetical protein
MKVSFCGKFQKYVSKQYCDFFNEGRQCRYRNPEYWSSIKELLGDGKRPEPVVNEVIKPFQCRLLL